MNKSRGIVLLFALIVTLVLTVSLLAFYIQSSSEAQMARRYEDSVRAFWLAEAGVASVLSNFSGPTTVSASVDDPRYRYSVTAAQSTGLYYTIVSTGTVTPEVGAPVSRTVSVTIRTGAVDPAKFKYGVETTTDLVVKGSVDINPSDSWKEYSTLDFADLFGITKSEMKDNATHTYTSSNFGEPVDGITWVDVSGSLNISGNLSGSGILIVNGDVHFSGTVDFEGIIYVIGKLTMTGTVTTYGSILAESSTEVDTQLKGNVEVNFSPPDVADALSFVQYITKEAVSWNEN
jgi:hypothetical protein